MKRCLPILLLIIGSIAGCAQNQFHNEIQEFARQDSLSPAPKHAILFVGSSSFRLWKNVQEDFPKHRIINRGFGGSTIEDVSFYKDRIIFPYSPKQIVIYCGENDIAGGATSDQLFNSFKKLYAEIRNKLPDVSVIYVSMKPSPSREKFKDEVIAGNKLIKDFLKKEKHTAFVDVYTPMLNNDGSYKRDLYIDDNLHMNEKGYAIWKKAIEPLLINK